MIKFKFKRDTWTNQNATPRYKSVTLVAGSTAVGTDPADSHADSTTRPGPPVLLKATLPATSGPLGNTDRGRGATDPQAVGSDLTGTHFGCTIFVVLDQKNG
jgi:hypothetical protein